MHISSGIEAQEILGEQPGSKTGKETEPVKQGPWAGARQLWGFIPGWGFWELVTSYSDVSTWNVRGEYLWCVRCHPPVTETSGKAEPPQDPAEKQAGAALRVEAFLNTEVLGSSCCWLCSQRFWLLQASLRSNAPWCYITCSSFWVFSSVTAWILRNKQQRLSCCMESEKHHFRGPSVWP